MGRHEIGFLYMENHGHELQMRKIGCRLVMISKNENVEIKEVSIWKSI